MALHIIIYKFRKLHFVEVKEVIEVSASLEVNDDTLPPASHSSNEVITSLASITSSEAITSESQINNKT